MGLHLAYLDSREDGMCLANYTHHDRALLNSFLCILNLENATLW